MSDTHTDPIDEAPPPLHEEPGAESAENPVVDSQSGDAVPAPAPAGAAFQEEIADQGAFTADEPTEVAEAPAEEGPKPAKKPRAARAKKAESEDAAPEAAEAPASEGAGVVSEAPAEPENKKRWYAIKVQSGREDTIRAAILRKVKIEGLEDTFSQILVPVDKVVEKKQVKVKDKKTGETTYQEKKVERKVKKFQGYIFAEMEFNDRMLYLIRETSGVGDFLKLRPRPNDSPVPEPMTDAEVKQMLGEKVGPETKVHKIDIEKGDRVKIKEGSFKDSEGEVKEVHLPKDPTDPPKLVVEVTFWGRPLPVELEYWQVTKV